MLSLFVTNRIIGHHRFSRDAYAMTIRLTTHALLEMQRRGITDEQLDETLKNPEQVVAAQKGRKVLQRRFDIDGVSYLIRAIVEDVPDGTVVVTMYRTSKIEKYWSL